MKKMLIATYGLYSGGVETSLLSLLNTIKNNYNITLLVLKEEGIHLKDIPSNIKVMTIPFKNDYFNIFKNTSEIKRISEKIVLLYYKLINKSFTLFKSRKLANSYFIKYTKELEGEFDIAIDYHGYGYFGTGYVAKKVRAKRKYTWIHSSDLEWVNNTIQFFNCFDKIFAVSNYAKEEFSRKYSKFDNKLDVFYNIIDYKKIFEQSEEFVPRFEKDLINILTVGRLEKEKGYDLLLDIAKELKDNNIKFNWYIIGKGSLKEHLTKRVNYENLTSNVILLGEQKNPYPYFKYTDIYVQTSNFEGYGLTIAEAKAFCKPIVCSDIPTFKEQIENNKNGFVCEQEPSKFKDKILEIINDEYITNKFIKNLKKQLLVANVDTIEKLEIEND